MKENHAIYVYLWASLWCTGATWGETTASGKTLPLFEVGQFIKNVTHLYHFRVGEINLAVIQTIKVDSENVPATSKSYSQFPVVC